MRRGRRPGLTPGNWRTGTPAAGLNSATTALRGELPTAQEFTDGAVLILGFNAGAKLSGAAGARAGALRDKLIDISERTGLRPEAVAKAAKKDSSVVEYLENARKEMPEALIGEIEKAVIYNDSRSLKVTFPKMDVEPSLTERPQLRKYIENIQGENLLELKNHKPEEYMARLKDMVREVFPDGGQLRFRKNDGGTLDYEHFLTDELRSMYIHTLPRTLRNYDISVEFTTQEGISKAYIIKKYVNPSIQKDIWDILVFHDLELTTKIARRSEKGSRYVESIILQEAGKGPKK